MIKCVFPFGNGVGIYNNSKLCVSIIDYNGNKKVGGENLKALPKFCDFFLIRGFVYFFYGIFLYIKLYLFCDNFEKREEKDKNKSFINAKKLNFASKRVILLSSLLLSFILGYLLFGLFPNFLYNKIFADFYYDYYVKRLIITFFRWMIIYLTMTIFRLTPLLNDVFSFNGAGCNYLDEKFTKWNITKICPLNFLNFLLNVFLFSTFMVSLIAVNLGFFANFAINLTIFLFCITSCYEYLYFANKSNWQWLHDLTIITNWLVCAKPNTTQIEVLQVAKIEMKNNSEFEMTEKDKISLSALYAEMQTKLMQSDRFEQSDMEWLVATFLNKNRAELKLVRSVTQKEYRDIMRACERRAKGEPLSSIFGFVDFYGLRFDVNKKVLSPRMETEILVSEVIKKIKESEAKTILDLCTGSGAIAVTIAKYTECKVAGSDISKQALIIAESNAKKNGVKVEFLQSDLFSGLKKNKKYDIIVSNPPYIKSGDIDKLDTEVKKYDPRIALDGGEDGLDFYRKIVCDAKKHLAKNGWLFFEIGKGQKEDVCGLLNENGYQDIKVVQDYSKIERIVYGRISK